MSKTSKIRRLMTLCLSMLLVIAGAVFAAPTASADEFTATVFSAPGWDYANLRVGPSPQFAVKGTIPAGSTVKLGCWVRGDEVDGPYGSSRIWYSVPGSVNDIGTTNYISDAMVYTGSDQPVTEVCPGGDQDTMPPSGPAPTPENYFQRDFPTTVISAPGVDYVNGRIGPTAQHEIITTYSPGSALTLKCYTTGSLVENPQDTTRSDSMWYYTTDHTWVSGAYVTEGTAIGAIPDCNSSDGTSPTAGVKPAAPRTWPNVWDASKSDKMWMFSSLFSHYYKGDSSPGVDARIDWAFFKDLPRLRLTAYSIPVGGFKTVNALGSLANGYDVYLSLGDFTIYRTSDDCFIIYDYYDFDEAYSYLIYKPYKGLKSDARSGKAQEFNVFSTGCYR